MLSLGHKFVIKYNSIPCNRPLLCPRGNSIVDIDVESGGTAQLVLKGGRISVPDGTIAAHGAALLWFFTVSVRPEIGQL